jgi:3-oxoacyl-[acyl-carrier protein] reductase
MNLGIQGKRALVQGASSGLGYAIARALLREGVKVAICARPGERLKQAQAAMGAQAAIAADLSRPGESARAVAEARELLGGLDILVVNTGGPPKAEILQASDDQWRDGVESLWMGAVGAIREALPPMMQQKWGRILLVTSAAAREPMAGLTISNGLRAGLLGLTKSISNEVAHAGVTINALLPGYTDTERLRELGIPPEKIAAVIPARRLGRPEEFAATAAFLASEPAAYITGQALAVDGGFLRGI